jgi:hypothetical protein
MERNKPKPSRDPGGLRAFRPLGTRLILRESRAEAGLGIQPETGY